jgi:hypothetical protein
LWNAVFGGIMANVVEIEQKLTPRRAIRKHCIDCVGGASEVRDCQGDKLFDGPCLFYRYRMGRGRPSVRLIRKHCLWCMGGSWKLVKECPSKTCPFLAYRLGKNPKVTARKLSDKQLKVLAAGRSPFKSGEGPLCPLDFSPESTRDGY